MVEEVKEKKQREKKPPVLPHVQAVIDLRRDIVASLVARGMRQTEIAKQLATPTIVRNGKEQPNPSYLINPESGEPFDKATIHRDVTALKAGWRKSAAFNADEFFGRQLAEIEEVKRRMWAKDDAWGVARAIELEMKLTGTAKPERKEVKLDDNQFKQMQSAKERVRNKLGQLLNQTLMSEAMDGSTSEE